MKKVFIVLSLLLVTLWFAFATESSTLQLTAEIAQVKPTFKLMGSFDSLFANSSETVVSDIGGNAILEYTGESSTITAYFRIFQSGVAKYDSLMEYMITAGTLKSSTDVVANPSMASSNLSSQTPVTGATRTVVFGDYSMETRGLSGDARFQFNYEGTSGMPFDPNDYMAEVVYVWDISALPADSYSADIVLTISGS